MFSHITRLTNNPVEDWFKILKHQLIKDEVKPSIHADNVLNYVLSKYIQYNKTDVRQRASHKETHENDEENCLVNQIETRKDKKKRRKNFFFQKLK